MALIVFNILYYILIIFFLFKFLKLVVKALKIYINNNENKSWQVLYYYLYYNYKICRCNYFNIF